MGRICEADLDAVTSGGRPMRVLAVDDAPLNLELIAAMLEAVGYQLTFAANGAEAVEMSRANAYDLILMDLQMPVMDGATATQAIRASEGPNSATPIVAVTGNTADAQIEACLAIGMDDHLAKPFSVSGLVVKAAHWAGRRHAV